MTTKETEYPLEVNNLQDIATFEHTPAGLSLVSKISAPAGSHFAYISSHAPQPQPSWRTIQTSATTHTDPRSALLYMNHSCAPSVELHVYAPDAEGRYPVRGRGGGGSGSSSNSSDDDNNNDDAETNAAPLAGEVRVARDRELRAGDALTFFYPSTEWKFDRAFDCLCGAGEGVCLGKVVGAKGLDQEQLRRWYFNEHIVELARERDGL